MRSNLGKNEASPEAFRERLENAGMYIRDLYKVFYDLQHYVKNAILAANTDANTKADALFYYGVLVGSFYILQVIDMVARDLSLVIKRRDINNDIMKLRINLRDEIIEITTKVINAYADLKKGKPLEDVKGTFDYLAWKTLSDIREFAKNLDNYFDYLMPT